MSAIRDALKLLERFGGMVPAAAVDAIVAEALAETNPDRVYTTDQASHAFGLSADYWQDRAREGAIEGAWQDSPGSPWYLPDRGIRVYLARKQIRETSTRSGRRGPYKERKTA